MERLTDFSTIFVHIITLSTRHN